MDSGTGGETESGTGSGEKEERIVRLCTACRSRVSYFQGMWEMIDERTMERMQGATIYEVEQCTWCKNRGKQWPGGGASE